MALALAPAVREKLNPVFIARMVIISTLIPPVRFPGCDVCLTSMVSTQGNPELRILTDAMEKIRYAGSWAPVERLSVRGLLPSTENYMTYEGSLTQPPCHETVTWVVLNKPIYITKQQLHVLRKLHQGTKAAPKAKMVNNFRPIQQMYHRPLRTNIDFTNGRQLNCPSMARQMYYTANTWR
ncbi:carbonic anhydrase-related protein 10-like [Penaeus japonicus]|uniref:carbonic anhydrase-related protein 10-like n=1 Tax=Penaeus japonicus TaxID=27405 RepID=UPI001C7142A3|nr:carbonic anhydrase-related protein 10-like [Penaeus japonicus]